MDQDAWIHIVSETEDGGKGEIMNTVTYIFFKTMEKKMLSWNTYSRLIFLYIYFFLILLLCNFPCCCYYTLLMPLTVLSCPPTFIYFLPRLPRPLPFPSVCLYFSSHINIQSLINSNCFSVFSLIEWLSLEPPGGRQGRYPYTTKG